MWPSVAAALPAFTKALEGSVPTMYRDSKGLVTVADGNLVDPVSLALALPFVHRSDGSPATSQEIADDWARVKAAGLGAKAGAAVAQLKLTDAGIAGLLQSTLASFEAKLRAALPNWEQAPADAQLGALSMAWAMGPGFTSEFPKWTAAFKAGQWATAAAECDMPEGENGVNPNLHPRNVDDARLFANAATVVALGLDPSVLYFPGTPGPRMSGASVATVLLLIGAGAIALHMMAKG